VVRLGAVTPKWASRPSQLAKPPQISRRAYARPNWQKSMATNWPPHVNPRAWRSACVATPAFWNSVRGKSPGDYDGDGRTDLAFFTDFNAGWYIYPIATGANHAVDFGFPGGTHVPAPGDYDGDGRTDPAFFYPATVGWFVLPSATGATWSVVFGTGAMTPVTADYDGDGKTDVALYDPTARIVWIHRSTTGSTTSVSMADVTGPGAIPVLKKPQ
jgi:hypothetical protein